MFSLPGLNIYQYTPFSLSGIYLGMGRDEKRLFFAFEIHAPWPERWPKGRLIEEPYRHLTVAFLGSVSYDKVVKALVQFPTPSFQVAPCGLFDLCIALPPKTVHVIAWHVSWFEPELATFQMQVADWLKAGGFSTGDKEWLSHVTVSRLPFDPQEWMEAFQPLPCYAGPIHLYESLGHSTYRSLWSLPFLPAFEEIEHVADIAFHIYGKDLDALYVNAFTALAFRAPSMVKFFVSKKQIASIEEVVILLNEMVGKADCSMGCPFKAVSFHGEVQPFKDNLLKWEMIVDV